MMRGHRFGVQTAMSCTAGNTVKHLELILNYSVKNEILNKK